MLLINAFDLVLVHFIEHYYTINWTQKVQAIKIKQTDIRTTTKTAKLQ